MLFTDSRYALPGGSATDVSRILAFVGRSAVVKCCYVATMPLLEAVHSPGSQAIPGSRGDLAACKILARAKNELCLGAVQRSQSDALVS